MLVAFVSNTIVWCYSVGVLHEVRWERREAPSSCSPALHRGTKCILIQSFQLVVLTLYVLKAALIVHWHVMSYAENYSWKLGKGCCSTATPSTISSFGFNNVRYVVFTTSKCWSMVLIYGAWQSVYFRWCRLLVLLWAKSWDVNVGMEFISKMSIHNIKISEKWWKVLSVECEKWPYLY